MKKLFTLLFVALLSATGANAQREIPLTLGGGWNAGFAGESDVYSYTINAKYLAAEFPCNVTSAEYSKCIVEFEEPLPENFAIPYVWKESADKEAENGEYGRTVANDTRTKFEVNFDPSHPYITKVTVQHMDKVSAKINKLKKLTLVSNDGKNNLTIAPTFGDWGNPANGTDDTQYYKGTVNFNGLYQQLKLNGVDGKKGVTIHVEFAENYENIQMCVDYEGDNHEWPQIGGKSDVTFTTNTELAIENVGIQFTAADQTAQVTVNSATQYMTDPTSINEVNTECVNHGVIRNLAGQRVNRLSKGINIIGNKKVLVK